MMDRDVIARLFIALPRRNRVDTNHLILYLASPTSLKGNHFMLLIELQKGSYLYVAIFKGDNIE